MSEPMISAVWGVQEEEDDNGAILSCIGFDEIHEDEDEDEDDDDDDDDDDDEDDEDEDEDEEYEKAKDDDDDDDVDISKLDPSDGRFFPNICDGYYDTIKWLINPQDRRIKPPFKVIGDDPNSSEAPVYNNCGTLVTSGNIQIGQQLNVVSLLLDSRCRLLRVGAADHHYIQPRTLKGKYVVLVCVFAPARWVEYNCKFLCQLRNVSQQLSEAQNFEMVIVPKMRQKCEGHKAAFHKLLSAFHGCLFVPFQYEAARDKICYRLNFQGTLKAILVDTCHNVAQDSVSDIVANFYYPSCKNKTRIKYLSSDWIRPPSPLREIKEKYLSFSSSLASLLDSSYGDPTLLLHNLSSTETTTVRQLNNKLVGLYIFQGGDKLKSLEKVYNQCRQKGLDFHVVVVCMSLFTSLDPVEFHRVVLGELRRLIPNTPWWVLPYNAATYFNLYNLCSEAGKDCMFTVGPRRKFFVDVHGGEVVHRYGIQAYPFNKEMIVRKYELGAKAITLDSMLSYGRVNYVFRGGKRVPVADLYDKVVVIYTNFELQCDTDAYKCLSKWYKEIRKQHSDFEVVFVYYEKPQDNKTGKHSSGDIDLLVRRFDSKHSKFYREHGSFFMGNNGHGYPEEGLSPGSTLMFGKGGKLCALDGVGRFEKYGLDGYPYTSGCGDNYVRDEIILSLAMEFVDFMSGYGGEKPYDVVSL